MNNHFSRISVGILFRFLFIVTLHESYLYSSEFKRNVLHNNQCGCKHKALAISYPLSIEEQKAIAAFARLPIALQSNTSYPLIELIVEYSPWFLVSSMDFSKCWIAPNGVSRAVSGCDHVTRVSLNYQWRSAGSGRLCDLWYYLGGENIIFKRDDIAQLQTMTLLKNNVKEGAYFEFESLCGRYKNMYTQGIGFEQFLKLDVASNIQLCSTIPEDEIDNELCSIL